MAVYLDGGPASGDAAPSSIVDLTGAVPRLLRAGAISEERLREVCGVLLTDDDQPAGDTKSEEPAEEETDTKPEETVSNETVSNETVSNETVSDGPEHKDARSTGASRRISWW